MPSIKGIKRNERDTIIKALRSGIVPSIGLQHIQVGRLRENQQIINDLDAISNDGSNSRFIIGDYGTGKTFFLNLSKCLAFRKNLVVLSADITTGRNLNSTSGKTLALYSELIKNMSVKEFPKGNALEFVIQQWASTYCNNEGSTEGLRSTVFQKTELLRRHVNYHDFAEVIFRYLEFYNNGDDVGRENVFRWIRGEYRRIADAKNDLGVCSIIKEKDFYSMLKLLSDFVVLAGFKGLLVCIDEMAVLTRLVSPTRNRNYERILEIVNETISNEVRHIGFLFGGTVDFLEDKNKGLYSYEALRSRLKENVFSSEEYPDYSGSVIRLNRFDENDLQMLCENIRNVFSSCNHHDLLSDEEITGYIKWSIGRLGAASYLTPRDTVKEFVGLLSQLENYPETNIATYLDGINIQITRDDSLDDEPILDTDDNKEFDTNSLFDFKL